MTFYFQIFHFAKKKSSDEVVIKAPPEALFPLINHSKVMNEWVPWADSDPEMKMEYSGPEEGLGSKSNWKCPGKMFNF